MSGGVPKKEEAAPVGTALILDDATLEDLLQHDGLELSTPAPDVIKTRGEVPVFLENDTVLREVMMIATENRRLREENEVSHSHLPHYRRSVCNCSCLSVGSEAIPCETRRTDQQVEVAGVESSEDFSCGWVQQWGRAVWIVNLEATGDEMEPDNRQRAEAARRALGWHGGFQCVSILRKVANVRGCSRCLRCTSSSPRRLMLYKRM